MPADINKLVRQIWTDSDEWPQLLAELRGERCHNDQEHANRLVKAARALAQIDRNGRHRPLITELWKEIYRLVYTNPGSVEEVNVAGWLYPYLVQGNAKEQEEAKELLARLQLLASNAPGRLGRVAEIAEAAIKEQFRCNQ